MTFDVLEVKKTLTTEEEQQKDKRNIVLSSSITNKTEELKSVRSQELEEGRPVAMYEMAQNQVDNSVGGKPQILLTINGIDKVFSGKSRELNGVEEEIEAVKFVTFGEGMSPNDVVLFLHNDDGREKLGINGRGGSIAFAYYVSSGMDVHIKSNRGGMAYEGDVKMVDVEDKPGIQKMVFEYHETGRIWNEEERITTIEVKNPNDLFINSLENLPKIFLLANPNYYGAKLVEPNKDAAKPAEKIVVFEKEGKKVIVECLLDLPEERERWNFGSRSLMIGGLKVESNYSEKFYLPWSIWGGESLDRGNGRVKRSSDSSKAEGEYCMAIEKFLKMTSSEKILEKILEVNERYTQKEIDYNYQPMELGLGYSDEKFSKKTIGVMKKVLTKRYGNKLPIIVNSDWEQEECEKRYGGSEKILRIRSPFLESLLLDVGCEKYSKIVGNQEVETSGTLDIRLIDEKKAIGYLAELIEKRNFESVFI